MQSNRPLFHHLICRRCLWLVIFLAAVCILPSPWLPQPAMAASPNEILDEAAEKLVTDVKNQLDHKNISLKEAKLEVMESSFAEQETGLRPPFSGHYCRAVRNALSHEHAAVMECDSGAVPFYAEGSYFNERGRIKLNLVIYQKQKDARAVRIAESETEIPAYRFSGSWFITDFADIARRLVRDVENHYHGGVHLNLDVKPLAQAPGHAPLLFAVEFQHYLENAVHGSAWLGDAANEYAIKGRLQTTYMIVDNAVQFAMTADSEDGGPLSSASRNVDIIHIPESLLTSHSDKPIPVCSEYKRPALQDSKTDTELIESFMAEVNTSLKKAGLPPSTRCNDKTSYRVIAGMVKTPNKDSGIKGYARMDISISIDVLDKNGMCVGMPLYFKDSRLYKENGKEYEVMDIRNMIEDNRLGECVLKVILDWERHTR